jgi:hypothetical protein
LAFVVGLDGASAPACEFFGCSVWSHTLLYAAAA